MKLPYESFWKSADLIAEPMYVIMQSTTTLNMKTLIQRTRPRGGLGFRLYK